MSKFSFHRSFIVTAAASLLALGACQTIDPFTGESKVSSTVKGGAIGAAGGAVIGTVIGAGPVAGAAVGGATGAAVGALMDGGRK